MANSNLTPIQRKVDQLAAVLPAASHDALERFLSRNNLSAVESACVRYAHRGAGLSLDNEGAAQSFFDEWREASEVLLEAVQGERELELWLLADAVAETALVTGH